MHRVIDRPIGTRTRMVEFPFQVLNTKEKCDNFLAVNKGKEWRTLMQAVDPNSFRPSLLIVVFNPSPSELEFGVEFYEIMFEYVPDPAKFGMKKKGGIL